MLTYSATVRLSPADCDLVCCSEVPSVLATRSDRSGAYEEEDGDVGVLDELGDDVLLLS